MEALPKIVRQRLQGRTRRGIHPHADLLTAFAEKTLTERERTQVIEHLSRCEDCREVMFLSAPHQVPAQVVGKIPSRAGWLSWSVLRWGSAVACVVVVGTAVTLHYQESKRSTLRGELASEKAEEVKTSISPGPVAALAVPSAPSSNAGSPVEHISTAAPSNRIADTETDTDEDKLMAKAEPAPRPQPRAMTATPQFQVQFDQSRQSNGNEIAENGAGVGGAIGGSAGSAAGKMVAPAPAVAAAGANPRAQPESDQKQSPANAPRDAVNVPAASGMIQVEASSAPVETRAANAAKSKDASSAMSGLTGGNLAYTMKKSLDMPDVGIKLAPRWMLSPTGALQGSWDSGKTWETVQVADKVFFQAFAAFMSEVWVGGANGVLYHSSDAGLHWAQVMPKANGESLTSGVTRIEFSDAQNGKVTTASGETWTTSDAGQTWQKN